MARQNRAGRYGEPFFPAEPPQYRRSHYPGYYLLNLKETTIGIRLL